MEKLKNYYKDECTLVYCPHCKTFYKGVRTHKIERFGSVIPVVIQTDFGDNIYIYDCDNFKCPKCEKSVHMNNHIINSEDWIANMFFKIKGEK